MAIAAVKPRAGEPLPLPAAASRRGARARDPARLARFAAGSLAGAMFIPVALWFSLVRKLRPVRRPLAVEQGVDDLALPLALDVLVLDHVRLLAHPEALEDARDAALRASRRPKTRCTCSSSKASASSAAAASVA